MKVMYEVRDYTMEQKGFSNEYTSELFQTIEEAYKEIMDRQAQDKALGIFDEYYVKEVEIHE